MKSLDKHISTLKFMLHQHFKEEKEYKAIVAGISALKAKREAKKLSKDYIRDSIVETKNSHLRDERR